MAKEISVTGHKKIRTLQKEFTAQFPYISLAIFPLSEKNKKRQAPHDINLNLSEVRTVVNPGKVSIHGRTLVGNLEKKFEEIYGIYVQVCFTTKEGRGYYTSGESDKLSLTKLNAKGEAEGWKKGEPH